MVYQMLTGVALLISALSTASAQTWSYGDYGPRAKGLLRNALRWRAAMWQRRWRPMQAPNFYYRLYHPYWAGVPVRPVIGDLRRS